MPCPCRRTRRELMRAIVAGRSIAAVKIGIKGARQMTAHASGRYRKPTKTLPRSQGTRK